MKRTLALLALLSIALACVQRRSERVAPGWCTITEKSMIAEAGGYHPFLWRKSGHVSVMVDTDTYSVTNVGDDCVVWYGLESRGLFMACGDHQPLLLQGNPTQTGIHVTGDELHVGSFTASIASAKVAANRQPVLTSAWKATNLR